MRMGKWATLVGEGLAMRAGVGRCVEGGEGEGGAGGVW